MSVRFVLKVEDVTYFVADLSPDISREDFKLEDVFVKRYPSGVLFAYKTPNTITDYIRTHTDLLRHSKKKPLDRYHLITHFTKNIRQFILDERLEDIDEDIASNRYFIATQDSIFQVFDQYRILTITDYASYGPYEDVVFEYLQTHDVSKNTFHHIKTIMHLLERLFPYVSDRFVIMNQTNQDVIFKEDIK
jgi:hypothetical protein